MPSCFLFSSVSSVFFTVIGIAMLHAAAAAAEPEYVGSQTCRGCHAAAYDAWKGSQHERAMEKASAESVLGNFHNATFTYFGVTSRFFKKGARFYVATDGPEGKPHDYEITYTFGVYPLQQYLIAFPDGRLQALGIAWDARPKAQGGQRWFHLYPDEPIRAGDVLHWTGLEQNWNFMCAECHSTNVKKNYDPAGDSFKTSWSEINVGCEACHGAGGRHVEWARKRWVGGTATAEPDNGLPVHFTKRTMAEWIIDPKSGTAKPSVTRSTAVEIETCGRCHARRSQLSEDHRPGKPLLDTHRVALLEPELYHADGQMQGEVYNYGSFLQSKMYHSGVTCGDCHEPHAAALRHPGNATCLQCHDSKKYDASTHHHHKADSAATKCAGCHMPVRTYMVVDPRHDHSFRIPRPDLTVTLGTPNACNDCHGDKTPAWAAEAVERWFGPQRKGHQRFAGALAKGRTFGDGAEQSLIEIARDADTPGIARATALELLQSYPSAASMAVVRQDLTAPDPLVRLAAVEALQGDAATRWRLGSPLLRDPVRTVRMAAGRTLADALPPESPITDRTALADAVREYVDAQQLNADRPEAHANLGTLFAQVGEAKRAEAEYKAAIKLSPAFIPAYVNLADLYKSLGRDADGEQYLKEALTHDASNAAVHHALGLLKVRQKRLPEALDLLQKAAALAPNQPRYAYVHGVALHSTGKVKEGLAVLEQAHQRFPGEREILTALITMHRDQGNVEQAQLYARKLLAQSPEDPQARALVAEMEKAGKP